MKCFEYNGNSMSFKHGKVYKGSFELKGWAKVSSLAKIDSTSWQEVPKPKKTLSEKIEKLKKQAEKEGMKCEVVLEPVKLDIKFTVRGLDSFERLSDKVNELAQTFSATNPKDEWEGVEFVECLQSEVSSFTVGKIYRVNPNGKGVDMCDFLLDNQNYPNGFVGSNRKYFKPSTEQAYFDQLKAKANELFGDIKEGDRFLEPIDNHFVNKLEVTGHGWGYLKDRDILYFENVFLYRKGKWAERVKERVRVELTH